MTVSPSTSSSLNDVPTVLVVGALAATLATICHETLGHTLGCVGAGGHVTLLTSIWFHCSKGSALADAGGPLGNLLGGVLGIALLSYTKSTPTMRLLLLLFSAISLFWFTGQLAY